MDRRQPTGPQRRHHCEVARQILEVDFGDIVRAVAAEPRMMCLSAPTVVAQADRDALLPLLQGKALAGASEAVGEIAILD